MKKLNVILIATIITVVFQACKSNKSQNTVDSSSITTTQTDTTQILLKDTAKIATNVDSADVQFANKAAIGGMAEVALGKLALEKTTDPEIKNFANMMVTDHSKANDELATIANNKHITLPTTVDAEHQQKMDELGSKTGVAFNKAYVNAMVEGHKSTLTLMRNEATNGKDADLKNFADKTSVIVQMHTDMITKIKGKK